MTGMARNALAEASRRNAEVAAGHGHGRAHRRRSGARPTPSTWPSQQRASDVAGGLGALSKVLRMALQSGVLGVGAYLVIEQQATAGIIIASSILTSRALAPVELAIANWNGFVAARQSWQRLTELFAALPTRDSPMALPPPSATLLGRERRARRRRACSASSCRTSPSRSRPATGSASSGRAPRASRRWPALLVGVWTPVRGKVRLDGAALDQWEPEALGQHIGYLPQDVELFAGTVAENIARFEPEPDAEAIIAAAKAAGVHELILRLPDGYDTQIGEGGAALSAGQRQRIALARALYGDPFLVVLDEPNSNLDAEGEQALTQAILGVRARGGIVVVIAHRPSALAGVDLVLVMADGQVQAFGPKDEVLNKVLRRPGGPAAAEPRRSPPASGRPQGR